MGKIIFVTGGTRSGKSAFAQKSAESFAGKLLYIATAEPRDGEMAERIKKHQLARGQRWETAEEPLNLLLPLKGASNYGCALLDCLTLWTSNLMEAYGEDDEGIMAEAQKLADALKECGGNVVVVTGEVGLGIVPADPVSRRFRDLAGLINQKIASVSDEAYFVVAGKALRLS